MVEIIEIRKGVIILLQRKEGGGLERQSTYTQNAALNVDLFQDIFYTY